ncbi:hypothetical protein IGI04_018729, partial [Brassica rapa subsp. trilocularis]
YKADIISCSLCNTPAQAQVEKAQQRETLSNPNPNNYKRRCLSTAEPSETHQAKPCETQELPPPPARRGSAAVDHRPRSPSRRSRVPSRRLLDSVELPRARSGTETAALAVLDPDRQPTKIDEMLIMIENLVDLGKERTGGEYGKRGGRSVQNGRVKIEAPLSHHKPTKRSPARHESCRRHQHAEEAPPSTTVRAAQVADRGCQAASFSILWSVTACTSESQIRNRNCYLAVLDPVRQPIKVRTCL